MKTPRCPVCRGRVYDADDWQDHAECIRERGYHEPEPDPDPTPREPRT